jgi:nucleoid-associated protein YgaU
MSLQLKYRDALEFGQAIGTQNGSVKEADGILTVGGTVETQYQKDKIWDKIKAAGGATPTDIVADIKVTNTSYYGIHVVQKGDSLSKIAKDAYGDMMQYPKIFEANRSILKSADAIEVGQELVLPF